MTDKPTPKELDDLFVEETGFDPDDFPVAIFCFTRAALTKWGTLRADKIVIPTDTMEQEFQQHYRRGYEAGKKASTPQPTRPDPAYSEACNLATALFKKHFAHLPDFASGQAVWSLCDSTAGVISQIDNMVSGLVQPPTTAFSEDEL